jgi:hypothetical protein
MAQMKLSQANPAIADSQKQQVSSGKFRPGWRFSVLSAYLMQRGHRGFLPKSYLSNTPVALGFPVETRLAVS